MAGAAWVQENSARAGGGQARHLPHAGRARAGRCGAGELDVGDSRIAVHRSARRAARAASLRIRSIRRIWFPSSSCAARRGPAAATIERAKSVMTEVGQVPIVVRRELDGFILNRLQGALLSEAMRLVGEGYVSPEDLDKTVAHGLGLRWSFMGPFATIELNAPGGVADYCARYGGFYRRLAADPPAPEVWDGEHVARVVAALGEPPTPAERERKTNARDRRLLALAAAQARSEGVIASPAAVGNVVHAGAVKADVDQFPVAHSSRARPGPAKRALARCEPRIDPLREAAQNARRLGQDGRASRN